MKALKITIIAIALLTGVGASAQAGKQDGCISKSLHGLWDCR